MFLLCIQTLTNFCWLYKLQKIGRESGRVAGIRVISGVPGLVEQYCILGRQSVLWSAGTRTRSRRKNDVKPRDAPDQHQRPLLRVIAGPAPWRPFSREFFAHSPTRLAPVLHWCPCWTWRIELSHYPDFRGEVCDAEPVGPLPGHSILLQVGCRPTRASGAAAQGGIGSGRPTHL